MNTSLFTGLSRIPSRRCQPMFRRVCERRLWKTPVCEAHYRRGQRMYLSIPGQTLGGSWGSFLNGIGGRTNRNGGGTSIGFFDATRKISTMTRKLSPG